MKHLYYDIPGFKETTNFEHIKKVKKSLGSGARVSPLTNSIALHEVARPD